MSHTSNTEIVYGLDAIIKRTLKRLSIADKKIDVCISGAAIEGTVKAKPVFNATISLKKKGVKLRYITEITRQNIPYVKELMKTAEFRHMEEIKGNYSIVDDKDYQATASVIEGEGPTESVLSTARAFVEQQQFVFDMLWKKAIPAKQRFREIEEGSKREFIDTVQDKDEIQNIISKMLSIATDEIDMVFPTKKSFYEFEKDNFFRILDVKVSDNAGMQIKILSECDSNETGNTEKIVSKYQNLKFLFMDKKVPSKVLIIITDKEYALAVELKDNQIGQGNDDENNEMGLAIYSNSKYTVLSYDSIFETLWIKAEMKLDRNKRNV
jgi:hypothetical protein